MKTIVLLLFIVHTIFALEPKALRQLALEKGLQAIPSKYEQLKSQVDSIQNPMSDAKIDLGKKLFFDKNLSKNRDISCATCHKIDEGGDDNLPTAIGDNHLQNPSHLNAPTVLNTAFSKHFFWDGRATSLREQAKGPTQATFEMASTPQLIEKRVKENRSYAPLFRDAFGNENNISFDTITKAIAVYEKTLVTRGKFDAFLEGDDRALSQKAQKGLELFINLGCKGCHFGPAVGGQKIQRFPLRDYNSIINISSVYDEVMKKRHFSSIALNFKPRHPYPFENRGGFLGKNGTQKFRVPILRNITLTAPYFHNGMVSKLQDAIFIMGRYQIGVDLNKKQLQEIEAFLKSLEGKALNFDFDK